MAVAEAVGLGVVSNFVANVISSVAPDKIKKIAPALFYGGASLTLEADKAFERAKRELLAKYEDLDGVQRFLSPVKTIKGGVLNPLFNEIFLGSHVQNKKLANILHDCFDNPKSIPKNSVNIILDDIRDTIKRFLLQGETTSGFVIQTFIREIRVAIDEVYAISQRNNDVLNLYADALVEKEDEFSRRYLSTLRDYVEDIFVRGLDMVTKRDQIHHRLRDAYVPVYMEELGFSDALSDDDARVNAIDIVRSAEKVIVRGPAGCGKTTLMQWIIWNCDPFKVLEGDDEHALPYFPIYIPLRRLDSYGTQDFSIDNVIYDSLLTPQLKRDIPSGWLGEIVKRNISTILLVDGFDEVQEIHRPKVWSFIRKVAQKYPSVRMLITSRHVSSVHLANGSYRKEIFFDNDSYLLAKRLWDRPDGFFEFSVSPMQNSDVVNLIDRWFDGVDKEFVVKRNRNELNFYPEKLKEELFSSKNSSVLELARTPLLCALTCMVFFLHEGRLPRSRRQLYDYSTELLVESRDEARGIVTAEVYKEFDSSSRLRMLRYLALIMQEGSESQAADQNVEVAKSSVINWIKSWLSGEVSLSQPAEVYLDFLINRCSIIREPASDRIDFVHRSFMECLAADEIVRTKKSYQLRNKIHYDEWMNTLQFCMDTKFGGAYFGSSLVSDMMEYIAGISDRKKRRVLLVRAVSLLSYIEEVPETFDEVLFEGCKDIFPPDVSSEVDDYLGIPARILERILDFDIVCLIYTDDQLKKTCEVLCRHRAYDTKKIILTGYHRLEDKEIVREINHSGKLSVTEHYALRMRVLNKSYPYPVYLTTGEIKDKNLRSSIIKSLCIRFPATDSTFVGWDYVSRCVEVNLENLTNNDLLILRDSVKVKRFDKCKHLIISKSHGFDFSHISFLFPNLETICIQRSSGFSLSGSADMKSLLEIWVEFCTRPIELRDEIIPVNLRSIVFYRSISPEIVGEIRRCEVVTEKISRNSLLSG